ncbi:competence pheromone ComX [Bacillus mangrovi]|uniref:ComX pheromone n=1 Tax=Metabacillus mangrovi TaxID=1491830 RepID=A0A7X2V710_9BACI|nr:competence pheromone ComX [Metabacillus mangrovi]MTH55513.1 competence pheromone ComX [Metabacillus mangrovi]
MMQEVVNYLLENPEVIGKIANGEASVVGLEKLEEITGLLEGIINSGKTLNIVWC